VTITLINQLAEYLVPNYPIGSGSYRSSTILENPPPISPVVQDSQIQALLQQEIANGSLPMPTANSLYFVYLPPAIAVQNSEGTSCENFCGYHDRVTSQLFYAVMPYLDCSGCSGGLDIFAALTVASSHELCEAITDPIPGSGWYDDTNGEIGDICAWQTKQVANYTVQKEWSNQQQTCL